MEDNQEKAKVVQVGLWIKSSELEAMKAATHVDKNAPAILAMARFGLQGVKNRENMEVAK